MKALLISINEFCYNPRLVKAAHILQLQGADVTVFNGVVGLGDKNIYEDFKKQHPGFKFYEGDISRDTLKSNINWFLTSLIHKFFRYAFLNRTLLLFPSKLKKQKFDLILINVIDNLEFACRLKKIHKSLLVYDSQEFFTGQYEKHPKAIRDWVEQTEKKNIYIADIVLTTTNVMRESLLNLYTLSMPVLRVRNTSLKIQTKTEVFLNTNTPKLRFIWHGFAIHLHGNRGIHLILEALAECDFDYTLSLQGNLNPEEKLKITAFAAKLSIRDKLLFVQAANPDQIVESLYDYDIGVLGEIPNERNQYLTSSNKLFEYISAGLAVIGPDLPGIAETLNEFDIGLKYKAGDPLQLCSCMKQMASDKSLLDRLKSNSRKVAAEKLYWEHDFTEVTKVLEHLMNA